MSIEFSDFTLEKGRRYADEGRVSRLTDDSYVVAGTEDYRVTIETSAGAPAWAICSCPHGRSAVEYADLAKCSHVVAVLLTIRQRDESMRGLAVFDAALRRTRVDA